jgi:hypothetical protein
VLGLVDTSRDGLVGMSYCEKPTSSSFPSMHGTYYYGHSIVN